MNPSAEHYPLYLQVLREELLPAMGCTEPIAIAYGAAKAREVLGCMPDSIVVAVSGNILKNVRSVIVPNTGGMKGVAAAAVAGVVAGKADKQLEVISQVDGLEKQKIAQYLDTYPVQVSALDEGLVFDILVTLESGESSAAVRISQYHTNIVHIEKDREVLFHKEPDDGVEQDMTDRSFMTLQGIFAFAQTVGLEDVEEVIGRQIRYNTAISQEGLRGDYGANIGRTLLDMYGGDIKVRAKAAAAAGSDARMAGCELPVVIAAGSGNQGMTASLPVIEYAKELGSSREQLLRALVLSNLATIHQKTRIGRLSAYCGAVSAGAAAGAAIAYLQGGGYDEVAHTLVNALAIVSGMVCDGAKPSCAAKIAAAVDGGLLGYHMYRSGYQFEAGDGLVTKGVEENLINIGRLGKDGMRETDKEIIQMMLCSE